MKGLVKYRAKSNNKKTPSTTKLMLNFIALECFHMLQKKTDQILNVWPGNLQGIFACESEKGSEGRC